MKRVLSKVNNAVREVEGKRRRKTIHVNCAKSYVERNVEGFCALTMLADDMGLEESKVKLFGEISEQSKEEIEEVLEEIKEEMDESDGKYVGSEAKIVIEPGTQPKSHKPYRVPDSIRDNMKEAVEQLVTEGKVEETESARGARTIPIPKPDECLRICMDYCSLNAVTSQVQCQILMLEDMLSKIGNAKFLSEMDFQKGSTRMV